MSSVSEKHNCYRGAANFFCNGSDSKYSRFLEPYTLCYSYSAGLGCNGMRAPVDDMYMNMPGCIPAVLYLVR